jgi:hypothetical protein
VVSAWRAAWVSTAAVCKRNPELFCGFFVLLFGYPIYGVAADGKGLF